MPKAEFIEEIISRRSKLFALEHSLASSELERLKRILEATDQAAPDLLQLAPVRIVACIEGCLKASAAQLLNSGSPYLDRARKLFGSIKLDFEILTPRGRPCLRPTLVDISTVVANLQLQL